MKPLLKIIRDEITANGVLPFARFMELALYCPVHGYYEKQKDNVGRRGDFMTSVSTGDLFGQLLAFQFARWLEELPVAAGGWRIVESGAHDGKLARDILGWLQLNRPGLFDHVEYGILEPSAIRREWQRETLETFAPRVHWHSEIGDSTFRPVNGIIFSNELLDALPVRRFGWDAKNKKWFEWGIACEKEKFVWSRLWGADSQMDSPSSIFHLPFSLLEVLPDGYIIETSPGAENWWREAGGSLERGKLVAIDYGLTDDEVFSPSRTKGTLRAYHRHHLSNDLLADAGDQDLTAHVNFSAIQRTGESVGLKTDIFSTQTKFLTQILKKTLADKTFGEWTSSRARQFQTLTHPEHLGRAFRVLVQSR
jgi:SAM-dependent MidA family methyltransferase